MFSRSGNPLLTFLQSYHVWVTSKIQVDFRFNRYSEVLVIVTCRFLKFLHYVFMFLRSGNPLLTFLLSYHVWGTSKIQVTFRFKRFSRLPKHLFVDKKFSKFISSSRESRRTVTRPTLYCQLTFSTFN